MLQVLREPQGRLGPRGQRVRLERWVLLVTLALQGRRVQQGPQEPLGQLGLREPQEPQELQGLLGLQEPLGPRVPRVQLV